MGWVGGKRGRGQACAVSSNVLLSMAISRFAIITWVASVYPAARAHCAFGAAAATQGAAELAGGRICILGKF